MEGTRRTDVSGYERSNGEADVGNDLYMGNKTFEEMAQRLLGYMIHVASGKETLNEINRCQEIAIVKDGVIE